MCVCEDDVSYPSGKGEVIADKKNKNITKAKNYGKFCYPDTINKFKMMSKGGGKSVTGDKYARR